MKMDIEGSEYKVLVDLLEHGLLCTDRIQSMFIEFHHIFLKETKLKETPSRDLLEQITAHVCRVCHVTEILELDDETYLHDSVHKFHYSLNHLYLLVVIFLMNIC